MPIKLTKINLPEGQFNVPLQFFNKADKAGLKAIYTKWVALSDLIQKKGGRRVNLPEFLSEGIFCINFKPQISLILMNA